MAFYSDAYGAQRIYSYNDAATTYAKIKPVRGRAVEFRPLGRNRGRSPAQIIQDGDDYVVKLYHTDIIRFKPDNIRIIRTEGYTTPSTTAWLNAILPNFFSKHLGSIYASCHFTTPEGEECQGRLPLWNTKDNLFRNGDFLNPRFPETHLLSRKKINAVRKKYADFLNYLKGVESTLDGWDNLRVSYQDARDKREYREFERALQAASSGDSDEYYNLMIALAAKTSYYPLSTASLDPQARFNRILVQHYRDEVLEKKVHTSGKTYPVDNYGWAF